MKEKDEVIDELNWAIDRLVTAQALVNDARLAVIRADRKLGPAGISESLSSHIKQLEELAKEHGDCSMFMKATVFTLKGDDGSDIEIKESR